MLKIIVDENISFAEEAFSSLGEVKLLHGRSITRNTLLDADALIIRSITNVNESLLKDTSVKFVGTATIGTDHIDLDYLKNNNIAFASAKGCNADAVSEYVFTALFHLLVKKQIHLKGKTLGIIGLGNIGSRVLRIAQKLGLEVLQNDPPLQRLTAQKEFASLDEILKSDFITLHVPLNIGGPDNTYHLLNEENLRLIKPDAILINASRGPVIDNKALLEFIRRNPGLSTVLDVWENEPDFDEHLLEKIDIGSPHIAGYSLEGKINGTVMIYNALCKFINCITEFTPILPAVENSEIVAYTNKQPIEGFLNGIFSHVYNILEDDMLMRLAFKMSPEEKTKHFDAQRKNYRLRREFNNYRVKLEPFSPDTGDILKAFRFKLNQ